jgi:hypothetical protein
MPETPVLPQTATTEEIKAQARRNAKTLLKTVVYCTVIGVGVHLAANFVEKKLTEANETTESN